MSGPGREQGGPRITEDAFGRAQARVSHLGLRLERSFDPVQLIHDVRGIVADDAIPILAELADHRQTRVRIAVADALGRYSYSDAVKVLLALLDDDRPSVRVAAIRALGRMSSSDSSLLLQRAARDSSPLVRRAVVGALRPLVSTTPSVVLKVSTELAQDADHAAAAGAFALLTHLASRSSSSPVASAARDAARTVRIYRPAVTVLRRGRETEDDGLAVVGAPPGESDLVGAGPPATTGLGSALTRAMAGVQKPRYVYGALTGVYTDGDFSEESPEFLADDPAYAFRYTVMIGAELGLQPMKEDWGELPVGAADLAVALVADDEHIEILDMPPVGVLHLPESGTSTPAHFKIRGLRAGHGQMDLFVYHNGCLIMRANASLEVREGPPRPASRVSVAAVAPVLNSGADLNDAIRCTPQRLRACLFIERDRRRDELEFVLFAENAAGYVFESAHVPQGNAAIGAPGVRQALRNLVQMQFGMLREKVLQSESLDLRSRPDVSEGALHVLRGVAQELESDLFGDERALRLRKAIASLLGPDVGPDASGSIQIVSDDVFVPWQLLYLDDGADQVDPMRFWGMRFQLRHSTAKGSVPWSIGQPIGVPIAFVNETLPTTTIRRHRDFLPIWEGTEIRSSEDDVLDDLRRPVNERPACYFYCHAFSSSDADSKSWLALRDGTQLTLEQLKRTRVDPATKDQIVYRNAPLVFLNACHTGQVDSSFYRSFVGFFVHDKKAGAVIGTETEMPAFFATDFADRFWRSLAAARKPLGELLFDLRLSYWRDLNNPLGLLYSLYANGDPRNE